MTTSFLNFSKDPNEDITNAPQNYHDFKGKAVRLKVYWTATIWNDFALWSQSLHLLRHAGSILQKYTLRLDVKPSGASSVVHAAMRAKMASEFAKVFGPRVSAAVGRWPEAVRAVGGQILDQTIDDVAATTQGLLKFTGPIYIPAEGQPAIEALQSLYTLIEPVTEENRLVVVFVPIQGGPDGYTSTFPKWLPWVLVDPRSFDSPSTLLHEIGHACRLAHQQENGPGNSNIMYPNATSQSQLWSWQVDTIFDSYWCDGSRPKNWWVRKILPEGHPFLWEEDP